MIGIWNCSKCGEVAEYPNPRWRWNGYRWEHLHDGVYEPARLFAGSDVEALTSNLDALRALAVQLAEALDVATSPRDEDAAKVTAALQAARKAGMIE